jgi:hypothetical protein
MAAPRVVDDAMVDAYLARRCLDYLVRKLPSLSSLFGLPVAQASLSELALKHTRSLPRGGVRSSIVNRRGSPSGSQANVL